MKREVIVPPGWSMPLTMYSPAIKVGNAVHIAGIAARNSEGAIVGIGDCAAQTRCALDIIGRILATAGGSLADIAIAQVILKSMADWPQMNAVFAEYFPHDPPARYSFEANLARPEFLVEIVATAYLTH